MRGLGFLIPAALVALSTVCALRPPARGGRLATAAHLTGFAAGVVPFWLIGWLLVATASTWLMGDLATPLGLAGLVLTVAAIAGLAAVVASGARARAALAEALRRDLPGRPLDGGAEPAVELDVPRATPAEAVLPFRRRRPGVEHLRDLRYGDGDRGHRLDLYRNPAQASSGPVLVHFHGGRFVSGSKDREALPLLYHLAAAGWVTVSADYGLAPAGEFPQAHVDAKRVLAWVQEQIADQGGDPARVIVTGNSAGAHLALFAALTSDDPRYQPGFEGARTGVAAAIGLGGYYGPLSADRPDSSVAAHARDDAPPLLLIHADRDPVVPAQDVRHLAETLRGRSRAPVVHAALPGTVHSLGYARSAQTRAINAAVDVFCARALGFAGHDSPRARQ